jgi:soluble lytic murein transglycosylase-like protein
MLTSNTTAALRLSTIALVFSEIVLAQAPLPLAPVSAAHRQSESVRRMERAITRQKAALKNQAAQSDGFFTTAWVGGPAVAVVSAPPVVSGCDPIDSDDSDAVVTKAAGAEQLDPSVLRAVIRQESAFKPCAISSAGAMGLMQLMPATADRFHVADPFNMEQNVMAGAKYLKELLGRFHGDLKLALAAYNAGPERVDGDTPAVPEIPETQNYVTQIMKSLEKESLERVK